MSATGGASVEDALNLGERIETTRVDAVAERLQLPPRFRGFEVLGPEGKRSALTGSHRVDGAAVVPEDAVAVRFQLQDRFPAFVLGEKPGAERALRECEKPNEALDLPRAHVDPPRLASAATAVALMTRKPQARRVPRVFLRTIQSVPIITDGKMADGRRRWL